MILKGAKFRDFIWYEFWFSLGIDDRSFACFEQKNSFTDFNFQILPNILEFVIIKKIKHKGSYYDGVRTKESSHRVYGFLER